MPPAYHIEVGSSPQASKATKSTIQKDGALVPGGDYGTRTCDLMRVKRRGAMPHGGRSNQQSFSTIFTVILEKSKLFLEILS